MVGSGKKGEQLELLRKVTGEFKLKIFGMDRDEPSEGQKLTRQ